MEAVVITSKVVFLILLSNSTFASYLCLFIYIFPVYEANQEDFQNTTESEKDQNVLFVTELPRYSTNQDIYKYFEGL